MNEKHFSVLKINVLCAVTTAAFIPLFVCSSITAGQSERVPSDVLMIYSTKTPNPIESSKKKKKKISVQLLGQKIFTAMTETSTCSCSRTLAHNILFTDLGLGQFSTTVLHKLAALSRQSVSFVTI